MKVFGFPIRLHWSGGAFLTLFVFAGFAVADREHGFVVYFLIGNLFSFLALFSIFAHEFCHCLIARYYKMRIDGIVVLAFGLAGSISEEEFDSARKEFSVAAVAPFLSLLIAGLFWLLSLKITYLPLAGAFSYLAYINKCWGVFNLVPAFPLDGGRIFHSICWAIFGRRKATNVATLATVGLVVSFLILGAYKIFFSHQFVYIQPMFVAVMLGIYALSERKRRL